MNKNISTQKKLSERKITAVLLRLCVVSLLVSFVQLTMGNPSFSKLIDADIANAFLGTVAQVLAGILAIVFSISVLAIEIYADKYTTKIFSLLSRDKITWLTLGFLLFSILVFVIAMGVDNIPMCQWGFLATNFIFAFCLLMTFDYLRWVFRLLDPYYLVERFKSRSLEAVRVEDNTLALENVGLLGDLALDMLKQEKYEIARKCLIALVEIYRDSPSPKTHNPVEEMTARILSVSGDIQKRFYEIFNLAIDRCDTFFAQYIITKLIEMLEDSKDQTQKSKFVLETLARVNETVIARRNLPLWRKVVRIFRQVHSSEVLMSLCDVFFNSAGDAFCRRQYDYVRELFKYEQFDFNAKFLTCRLLYTWNDCLLQYYLLCLAYSLRKPVNRWYPQDLELSKALPHFVERVLEQYHTVLLQDQEWNSVFDGNFQSALLKAKEWLLEVGGEQKHLSVSEKPEGKFSWMKRLFTCLWPSGK